MTGALAARFGAPPPRLPDPAVAAFADLLAREAQALGVLFYGSNLRTGSLEGVLDFYVLLPGPVERGIWPRVSYREREDAGRTLRAKIATMNLATFAAAARGQTIDTTIWARFVQPSMAIWVQGPEQQAALDAARTQAACTAARLAVALGPENGAEADYWRALFRATYKAEFRVEAAGREDSILEANAAHFDGLLTAALDECGIGYARDGAQIAPRIGKDERWRIRRWWARRRRLGKPLNFVRLLRAATTFNGASRYAAWKIERHTGVVVPVTPWRERHPLLAAPGVLWQVWRARRVQK